MSVNSSVITHDPASLLQDWHSVASLIDHTLLTPAATRSQVIALCAEAVRYGFYSVMVNPASLLQDWHSVASLIDHTLLTPAATRSQVIALCAEAVRYGFYSVMVNPAYV